MPQRTHERAAELHNLAAHAHAAAATAHGKGDHLTAHEPSKQAHEHSMNAHKLSEELAKEAAIPASLNWVIAESKKRARAVSAPEARRGLLPLSNPSGAQAIMLASPSAASSLSQRVATSPHQSPDLDHREQAPK